VAFTAITMIVPLMSPAVFSFILPSLELWIITLGAMFIAAVGLHFLLRGRSDDKLLSRSANDGA